MNNGHHPIEGEQVHYESSEKGGLLSRAVEGIKNSTTTKVALLATALYCSNGVMAKQVDAASDLKTVPDSITQKSSIDIFRYLKENAGVQFDPDQFIAVPAPKPLTGVVPKGHENDPSVANGITEVTEDNLDKIIVFLLIDRPEYPEQSVNYQAVLDDLKQNSPDVYAELVLTVKKYFTNIEGAQKENPYLTERAVKSIVSAFENIGNPQANTLAFMSDIYYLLVAMGEDVSSATQLQAKGGKESYIVLRLDKDHMKALSSIGVNLPLDYLDGYNETYERFVENGRSKEKNKGDFDAKT
ncbi:hypothetical protein MK079_05355, partial [Candidatus Gracilibacteria bacterium]|nr:hypothetical protein [Candidatus Gracilibacteria bacterium]